MVYGKNESRGDPLTLTSTAPGGRRRGRPPRVRLDLDLVLDAAMVVLASEGVDGLTMRRLAGHLDVPVMTLYTYVTSRDQLLDLVLDEILGHVDLPAPSPDWRGDVIAVATSLRQVLLSYRHASRLLAGRPSTGPHALDIAEFLLDALTRAGLTGKELVFAYTAVRDFTLGSTLQDATWAEQGPPSDQAIGRVREQFDALPPTRYPRIREALTDMLTLNGDAQFDYGLALLVDGLVR
jgi:TetR/AcrR family transcriptional regulator, tetracycline repressor protein